MPFYSSVKIVKASTNGNRYPLTSVDKWEMNMVNNKQGSYRKSLTNLQAKWAQRQWWSNKYLWVEVPNNIVSKLPNDVWSTSTGTFPAGFSVRSFTDLKWTESVPWQQSKQSHMYYNLEPVLNVCCLLQLSACYKWDAESSQQLAINKTYPLNSDMFTIYWSYHKSRHLSRRGWTTATHCYEWDIPTLSCWIIPYTKFLLWYATDGKQKAIN